MAENSNKVITVAALERFLAQLIGDNDTLNGIIYTKDAADTKFAKKNGDAAEEFNSNQLGIHNGQDHVNMTRSGDYFVFTDETNNKIKIRLNRDNDCEVYTTEDFNPQDKADQTLVPISGSNSAFLTTKSVAVYSSLAISQSGVLVKTDSPNILTSTAVTNSQGSVIYIKISADLFSANTDLSGLKSGFYFVDKPTSASTRYLYYLCSPNIYQIYYCKDDDGTLQYYNGIGFEVIATANIEWGGENYTIATLPDDIDDIFNFGS